MIVVTDALVDRIVDIEVANLESRLAPYASLPENPSGVRIEKFGAATAFVATGIPARFFNSVLGVVPETVDVLDEIIRFYDAHGVSPAFEIVPGRLPESFGIELGQRGFSMVEFHAGLARQLGEADRTWDRTGDGIEVVDPNDEAAFELFLDVYLEGWNGPGDHSDAKVNMRTWRSNATWTFYVARDGDHATAAGILDVRGKTALMGSASTRAPYRGRGVQGRMLSRRIADAAAAKCDLIVGGAYFGTGSMRNQQRAGLMTAFTRGIWVRR